MKKHHYPSRDPIRNYFPLPNEIFQLGLTPGELAVYSFLLQCENRETYQCYPSYKTIGKALNIGSLGGEVLSESLYKAIIPHSMAIARAITKVEVVEAILVQLAQMQLVNDSKILEILMHNLTLREATDIVHARI